MEDQTKKSWEPFADLRLEDQVLLHLKGGDGDEGEGIIIDDIIVGG